MAGLTHDDRIAFAKRICERMAEKYGGALLVGGIFGSVATETDTPYSDLEMLFIVANGCAAKPSHVIYRGMPASLKVMEEERLREKLLYPSADWEFFMGALDGIKLHLLL